jgi:diphthine synthase
MALYFIGLGLHDEKDISIKGLEAVKKCDVLYLEHYTSTLSCSKEALEKFYNKKIILASRSMVEQDAEQTILKDAESKNAGFLVVGDPFSATTHSDLYMRAKKAGIRCEVVHNASVISAVGVTGLQVYKFGKTTSIPFHNDNVTTPYDVMKDNQKMGLHTLFLLDLDPIGNRYMSVQDAIRYLLNVALKKGDGAFKESTLCIGCSQLGSDKQLIKAGTAFQLLKVAFSKPPQCLIVPGKLHFMEEEALDFWK